MAGFWVAFWGNVGAGEVILEAFSIGDCASSAYLEAFHQYRFVRVEPVLHSGGSRGTKEGA